MVPDRGRVFFLSSGLCAKSAEIGNWSAREAADAADETEPAVAGSISRPTK